LYFIGFDFLDSAITTEGKNRVEKIEIIKKRKTFILFLLKKLNKKHLKSVYILYIFCFILEKKFTFLKHFNID